MLKLPLSARLEQQFLRARSLGETRIVLKLPHGSKIEGIIGLTNLKVSLN